MGAYGSPSWFALKQVKGGCRVMLNKYFGVTRITWIRRCVSFFDSSLLARKFKGVKEEGDAKNAQGNRPWTIDHGQ